MKFGRELGIPIIVHIWLLSEHRGCLNLHITSPIERPFLLPFFFLSALSYLSSNVSPFYSFLTFYPHFCLLIRCQAGETLWNLERRWDTLCCTLYEQYYIMLKWDKGMKNQLLILHFQGKKGEIRPPKLKTEDPNKSYVQRPVKRG